MVLIDTQRRNAYNRSTMNIQSSLLSVCSVAVLLFFFIAGDTITIDSWSIDAAVSSSCTTICIHPVFLVWTDSAAFRKTALGAAFGNVIMLSSLARDEREARERNFDRVIIHERRHIEQFAGLGEWFWVSDCFLQIEPIHHDWNDPSMELAEMWQPPSWWPYRWSFVTLSWKI